MARIWSGPLLLGLIISWAAQAQESEVAVTATSGPAAEAPRSSFGSSINGGGGVSLTRSALIDQHTIGVSAFGGYTQQTDLTASNLSFQYREALINASIAPVKWVEIFASAHSSTYDDRSTGARTAMTNDFTLGAKVGTRFADNLVAVALDGALRAPPGWDPAFNTQALSPQFGGLVTLDLRKYAPVLVHLNSNFVLDHSSVLDDGAQSLSRRYALSISPYDSLRSSAAVEGRFHLSDVWLNPFLEYSIEMPFGNPSGLSASPMRLTPGLRVLPWRGVIVDAMVQVGLAGNGVDGLPPVPSYLAMLGLGYEFGWDSMTSVVERVVEKEKPAPAAPAAPKLGRIQGTVLDAITQKPIPDAVIAFPGRSRLMADGSGAFSFTDVSPGHLSLVASRTGYKEKEYEGTIKPGEEMRVEIELTAIPPPPPPPVTLKGTVISEKDKPLDATVEVLGVGPKSFPSGEYELKVPSGDVTIEASASGFLKQGRRLTAKAGDTVIADFVLKEVPKKTLVVLLKEKIQIKKQVHFATNKDVILPDSDQLLDEVASLILDHPELKHLRIEGHTDNQGDEMYNQDLSERRAQAVLRALVDRGVELARLRAVGYGKVKPIASNSTSKGRALNRRVEFMIEADAPSVD